MINNKTVYDHIKHVDSVTNVTAASGSKAFYPGSDKKTNAVSGAGLLKSISPNLASANQIATSIKSSETTTLP